MFSHVRTKVDGDQREAGGSLRPGRGTWRQVTTICLPAHPKWLICDFLVTRSPVNSIVTVEAAWQTNGSNNAEAGDMHTPKRRVNRKVLWRTIGLMGCLLVLSSSSLSQTKPQNRVAAKRPEERKTDIDANATEAQRRIFATSMVISLATEARSYKDLVLRTRVLARAADVLWDADRVTARALFVRAWEAAESADADDSTISPKVSDKKLAARISALKKLNGHDLRVDVLSLVSRRDRALAEQLLAKLKSDSARASEDAMNTRRSWDVYSGPEASLKRLVVANKLLAAGETAAAVEFAALALTDVSAHSIGFLSQLRAKDPRVADKIFADLLARVDVDPLADANTISGLSSYAFTPGFYIVFRSDGTGSWMQPDGPIVAPDLDPALRAQFFNVAANVLLRPLPPLDQDFSSCGRRGRLKIITRLLPLFEQYMREAGPALRSQLTAPEGRNINVAEPLLMEGINSENNSGEIGDIEKRLGRARNVDERDQIYADEAAALAPTGDKRARELAGSIDDSQLRTKTLNYVDLESVKFAIREKNGAEVARLAGTGELTHMQRSWSYTQAARLLLESDHDLALLLLQKAVDEAERLGASDSDASFALINVANQFLAIDRPRVWELLNKTIKFANATEDFTGDDIRMPKWSMIATRNGARFVSLPDGYFNFSRVLRGLAEDDLIRSIELAKTFQYDGPRAYATLAIAKAVLDKPQATTTAKN